MGFGRRAALQAAVTSFHTCVCTLPPSSKALSLGKRSTFPWRGMVEVFPDSKGFCLQVTTCGLKTQSQGVAVASVLAFVFPCLFLKAQRWSLLSVQIDVALMVVCQVVGSQFARWRAVFPSLCKTEFYFKAGGLRNHSTIPARRSHSEVFSFPLAAVAISPFH